MSWLGYLLGGAVLAGGGWLVWKKLRPLATTAPATSSSTSSSSVSSAGQGGSLTGRVGARAQDAQRQYEQGINGLAAIDQAAKEYYAAHPGAMFSPPPGGIFMRGRG